MEEGSHEELMKIEDGVYANLVNMQTVKAGEAGEDQKDNRGWYRYREILQSCRTRLKHSFESAYDTNDCRDRFVPTN